jgi:hypothetical protein
MDSYLEEFKSISQHYISNEEDMPKFEKLKEDYKISTDEKMKKYLEEKEIDDNSKLLPMHINELFKLILQDTQILTILSQHWGFDVFTSCTFLNFSTVMVYLNNKFDNLDLICNMAIHYKYNGNNYVIPHQF